MPQSDSESYASQPSLEIKDQSSQKQSWLGYVWDTADLGPQERWMMFKVDGSLLLLASLGYFVKNLDQSNIQSAFFAGMKEDLNMYGNELVHATSFWTAGYVIGQIPATLLLTRVSPRYVIPTLELLWGLMTLATYSVKSTKMLYALRFLVGLFESGFYPGMNYILGSWYTPRELGKRMSLFYASGNMGMMFSGFLQTAAYKHLNGVHGLAGWRWLMIIDAIITLPIALLGFYLLPNLPWSPNPSPLLSSQEVEMACLRMKAVGRKERESWSSAKFGRIFKNWKIYVLPFLFTLAFNAPVQNPVQYWMKSFNAKPHPVPGRTWTVSQIQLYPLPGTAIFVTSAIVFACVSDGPFKGLRWPFLAFTALYGIMMDTVWLTMPLYENIRGHFLYFWFAGVPSATGALNHAWTSEICGDDNELRAIVVALGNDLAYVITAIAPNFVWKTLDFPRATRGYHYSIILHCLSLACISLVLCLLWRDRQRKAGEIYGDTDSSVADIPEKKVQVVENVDESTVTA
ncbi:MFS general substrate transporter [Mycena indigotica]|uniref:MFS general substrate transporter n=1 Tax=Mycena indigotica TaxID=2126181 RepID=A0A8H6S5A5_9AGAR|nr:MFS general substrate transporter [Mycena indigotica]KAF7292077.1 MFS general substrate transporter [Mycena indigotica]